LEYLPAEAKAHVLSHALKKLDSFSRLVGQNHKNLAGVCSSSVIFEPNVKCMQSCKQSYFMTYFSAPISTIASRVLYPPIISLQRSVTIIIRPTL